LEVIKKNQEYQLVFEKGHSIQGRYLVVYFLHNPYPTNRFGICVGKKIGPAVRRNYVKRLLREAVRTISIPDPVGWDMLLVAKKQILKASLSGIIDDIQHILFKVNFNALKTKRNMGDTQ
jgi:ribonuclease P protein component